MYRQICGEICVCIYMWLLVVCFFFFKQKTAYDMRISDWSSDVCSSDLRAPALLVQTLDFVPTETHRTGGDRLQSDQGACQRRLARPRLADHPQRLAASQIEVHVIDGTPARCGLPRQPALARVLNAQLANRQQRPAERRVGKESVSLVRSR